MDWMIFNEQYFILVGWNLMSNRDYRCAAFRSLMIGVDWMMFNAKYLIFVGLYVMLDLIKRVRNYLCLLFTSTKSCLQVQRIGTYVKTSDRCLETLTSVLKVNYFDH
jgi:hypothetical protein